MKADDHSDAGAKTGSRYRIEALAKGLDVLKIDDKRTDPARKVRQKELNVQTQPDYFG